MKKKEKKQNTRRALFKVFLNCQLKSGPIEERKRKGILKEKRTRKE